MVFPPGYTRLFVATIIGETPLSQLITTCHRFGHKLLRHASIQMTERYAHLAPDYLHDAVASLGFSAH